MTRLLLVALLLVRASLKSYLPDQDHQLDVLLIS